MKSEKLYATGLMAKNETWQDVLDTTSERIKRSNGLAHFSSLESSEEKVKFCLRNDAAKPRLQHWLSVLCSSKHRKFWEKASELRSEGNLRFNKRQYERAIEFYTQSILSAPFPESPDAAGHSDELSLGFANRSAAFFHAGRYRQALYDIAYAFEVGYPSHLHYKLYLRKGQCQLRLGNTQDALNCFNIAIKCLRKANIDSHRMDRQLREIQNLKKACSEYHPLLRDMKDEFEEPFVTDIADGWHKEIPSCTSAIDMLYSTEKGRFLIANRDICPGEALFIEKPYASVLLPAFAKTHCYHCHKKLLNAVPCTQCNQVRYCTFACAKSSWTCYHRWECGNLDLLHSIGVAHLAFRVLLVTGLSSLTSYLQSIQHGDPNIKSHSYHPVYELVAHSEKVHIEDSLQYSLTAALLWLLLDRVSFFIFDETSSRFSEMSFSGQSNSSRASSQNESSSIIGAVMKTVVGGLLLRHIYQLVCNAHAITSLECMSVKEDDIVTTTEQVRVATAIYPSASLMNHSCDPNIISGFVNGCTLVVRAVRTIMAGEEVLNCYGPHYRKMPFAERQQLLQDQYFFKCACDACIAGDEPEQKLQALKCEYCEGPLRQPDESGKAECMACRTTQECLDREQKAFRMHDLYVQGVQLTEKGNHLEALRRLSKCLKSQEKLMYKHNVKLLETRDMVARCLSLLGDFRSACKVLRPALEAIQEIYGANSIELGNELQKMSDILVNAVSQAIREEASHAEIRDLVKEAKVAVNDAEEIFVLHYGRGHQSVKDLEAKRDTLSQVTDL